MTTSIFISQLEETLSIFMLLLLVVDLWALYVLFKSNSSAVDKLLWAILIIATPVFGLLVWYLLGPKDPNLVASTA